MSIGRGLSVNDVEFDFYDNGEIPDRDLIIQREYSLLEIYELTKEALHIASDAGYEAVSEYSNKRKKLDLIMDILDYQTAQPLENDKGAEQTVRKYSGVRSIFMPRIDEEEYKFGTHSSIIEPERWNEPLVQHFLETFKDIMSRKGYDKPIPSSDSVYSSIINPDVKRKIENRAGISIREPTRIKKKGIKNPYPKLSILVSSWHACGAISDIIRPAVNAPIIE